MPTKPSPQVYEERKNPYGKTYRSRQRELLAYELKKKEPELTYRDIGARLGCRGETAKNAIERYMKRNGIQDGT